MGAGRISSITQCTITLASPSVENISLANRARFARQSGFQNAEGARYGSVSVVSAGDDGCLDPKSGGPSGNAAEAESTRISTAVSKNTAPLKEHKANVACAHGLKLHFVIQQRRSRNVIRSSSLRGGAVKYFKLQIFSFELCSGQQLIGLSKIQRLTVAIRTPDQRYSRRPTPQ
jgi:hypothetical protein